jgi:hypothetical protein
MMLAKIEHGPDGADLRAFECLKCDFTCKLKGIATARPRPFCRLLPKVACGVVAA